MAGIDRCRRGAAVLAGGLERSYLAPVTNGPRWGFDVALLAMVRGLLAAVVCAALAGLAAAAVTRARGFGAGTVAGLLILAAVAVGTASAHLPLRAGYLAEPDRFPSVANLADGDLLAPFEYFLAALIWGPAMARRDPDRRQRRRRLRRRLRQDRRRPGRHERDGGVRAGERYAEAGCEELTLFPCDPPPAWIDRLAEVALS